MTEIDTSPATLRALAASLVTPQHGETATVHFKALSMVTVVSILRTLADEKEATAGPLVYRSFSCTPSHAVECAYLLSLAEAEYARDPSSSAAEIIELYARGDVSIEEAMDALAAPDHPEDPAYAE